VATAVAPVVAPAVVGIEAKVVVALSIPLQVLVSLE
jgi:hypothetical protein